MKDPTKYELYRAARSHARLLCDEHDHRWLTIEAAIWWFANDHYSGMWSNLYAVLSASRYHPSIAYSSIQDEPEEVREIYELFTRSFS
jgi:hypothetical protein